ncbi:MAG: hypothetical protein RIS94_1458 [Pseudomonadota bacterium]|jgi:hypothetical protein
MPLRYDASLAVLEGQCVVEEAGDLVEWLVADRTRGVDLSACTGLHTALLQTLMALRPPLAALPDDAALARWISPLLPPCAAPAAKPVRRRASRVKPANEPRLRARRAKKVEVQ